jgi:hypothetical protein
LAVIEELICPARAATKCLLLFDLISGKDSPIMWRWAALSGLPYFLATLGFAQNLASPPSPTLPDYSKEAALIESYHRAVSYEDDCSSH